MNNNLKYETRTIETEIHNKEDLYTHDCQVLKYTNNDWRMIKTIWLYENDIPIKKTTVEKYSPLPQRGLRAESKPIDDACDIKDEIRELIYRYKYNVSTSTTALYEEFIKDLEELIK